MDGWKHGKPYALVVSPLYQMPTRSSQIYMQAISRDVCLLSFSHVSVLVSLGRLKGPVAAEDLLSKIFGSIGNMPPTKSSVDYWTAINRVFLEFDPVVKKLWGIEKAANLEAIEFARREGLAYLASERESIVRLDHQEAISRLLSAHKIDNRAKLIQSTNDNGLFELS